MDLEILIKNTLVIVIILVIVFLSQQPYFKNIGRIFIIKGTKQTSEYLAKTGDWSKANIFTQIGGEGKLFWSSATAEITKQKNNFVEMVWENFKNYFAGYFSKTFGTAVK